MPKATETPPEGILEAPDLTRREQKDAEKRIAVSAPVVHEAIRLQGEYELSRPPSALAWSGLAAGLSMGFSMAAEGLFRSFLPDAAWTPLISRLGYSVGFLLVIIGRQQLFTENTLTAILPLLARRNMATLLQVGRLWSVVLVANLIGAHIFAWVAGNTDAFHPEVRSAFAAIGREAANVTFGAAILRGIFAGWLIAMIVWLMAATRSGRLAIIVIMTYVVALGGFTHTIAGSIEVLYLVMTGALAWGQYLLGYLVPALIGNVIGGVSLVSALNHAQVVAGEGSKA